MERRASYGEKGIIWQLKEQGNDLHRFTLCGVSVREKRNVWGEEGHAERGEACSVRFIIR